jgi:hypothetical protein
MVKAQGPFTTFHQTFHHWKLLVSITLQGSGEMVKGICQYWSAENCSGVLLGRGILGLAFHHFTKSVYRTVKQSVTMVKSLVKCPALVKGGIYP